MNKLTDNFINGNIQIPCIGYGTWQTPSDGTTRECVKKAIEAGYRHIDTAAAYGNEAEVGEGIRASGVKRDEIFLTTKHWVTERGYEKTIAAAEESMRLLGTDYLDLYLIHWPAVGKRFENWEEINADTWRGFERLYKDGKIRAIGVSNFEKKHIDALIERCEIKPMVNQLEFHPGFTQWETIKYMQQQDILVEAWSPLGNGAVLGDERIKAIADKYNKDTAQLCIRFALQLGILPLPKSTNPVRMKSNADVFGFEIEKEDIDTLLNLPILGYSGFAPEDAPADALCD